VRSAQFENGDMRATRNTPAVTMVAAWMSADTGVGPSMASGSQVCSRNCADLPIAPMNSSRQMAVITSTSQLRKVMVLPPAPARQRSHRTRSSRTDEQAEDAEREAEVADAVDDERLHGGGVGLGFLYQKPISR
jgi:hypothetical protein